MGFLWLSVLFMHCGMLDLGSLWFDLLNYVYIHSFTSIMKATEKLKQQPGNYPGGWAFDHLKWTYDEVEQLFGPGRGDLNKHFPKIQMPGGLPGGRGMLKLRFDWYNTVCVDQVMWCLQ